MEKVAGHTATPWGVERCEATPCYHIEAGAWPYGSSICRINENPNAEANAAFIVRAVNSHDELVAALKAIINSDMAMREEDEGSRSAVLDAARAALSRATKQEG